MHFLFEETGRIPLPFLQYNIKFIVKIKDCFMYHTNTNTRVTYNNQMAVRAVDSFLNY
jgi:hypothetical protein